MWVSCHFNQKRRNGNMQRIIRQLNNTLSPNPVEELNPSHVPAVSSMTVVWPEWGAFRVDNPSNHPSIEQLNAQWGPLRLRHSLLRRYKHDSTLLCLALSGCITVDFSACFFQALANLLNRSKCHWCHHIIIGIIIIIIIIVIRRASVPISRLFY